MSYRRTLEPRPARTSWLIAAFALLGLSLAYGCVAARDDGARPSPASAATTPVAGDSSDGTGEVQRGRASYYGERYHGRKTASGERFDMNAMTAAHRTLPFGTVVEVINLDNGRRVEVRINDRGPFGRRRRIIDVSRAAARALEMLRAGVVPVEVRVLSRPNR
ncbi:rare lipoprotein A [Haliangium ochraceum DSM 14365]|uniref:Probable endolytic peptidoglycan transglycosylase RlpA n=1 Tax=Haliangium ochraceum (strain DSM 14365 / JCM 11303 / SMP-2) TaxID=502025 RepID=D0LKG9_HALO1|nr:septal ring lytic transglycosylase RlpA family protein [Haliangium ochraceum]ACY15017.1 rare lipoprotein A [Haliangium ochraceum DSM 14365]